VEHRAIAGLIDRNAFSVDHLFDPLTASTVVELDLPLIDLAAFDSLALGQCRRLNAALEVLLDDPALVFEIIILW
jgi:hypothetical protein